MVSGGTLTVIGMGVVFLALGLLAVAAWVLERVFREREEIGEREGEREKEIEIEHYEISRIEKDIEAAIALALVYHTKKKGSIHIERVNESTWMQQTRLYT